MSRGKGQAIFLGSLFRANHSFRPHVLGREKRRGKKKIDISLLSNLPRTETAEGYLKNKVEWGKEKEQERGVFHFWRGVGRAKTEGVGAGGKGLTFQN